jgi:hypothetical protein
MRYALRGEPQSSLIARAGWQKRKALPPFGDPAAYQEERGERLDLDLAEA